MIHYFVPNGREDIGRRELEQRLNYLKSVSQSVSQSMCESQFCINKDKVNIILYENRKSLF